MPTSAEAVDARVVSPAYAVDTSVAVPALDAGHAAHEVCRNVVQRERPALAGHATFETFSVLTRMPGPLAVDAVVVATLMERVFPRSVWLDDSGTSALRSSLSTLGITGGAVYDALVGSAALAHGCRLLTRDRRAVATYRLLGVDYELVGI